jgi:hypothetical protein
VPVIQHRVSVSILCPLVRPKKAVGLESLIGSWLALEPTLSNACAASGAERVEHHRGMKPSSRNHQLGWSRYRGSQDQNPSRSEAGLDASDNIHVPTEGRGRIFLLTSPFIGQLTSQLFANKSPKRVFQHPQALAQACAVCSPESGSMHYERTPRFRKLKRSVALPALQTQDG